MSEDYIFIYNDYKKYLCLDIGNVLCDVDFGPFLSELNRHGISEEEAWFFLSRIQPLHDLGHTNIRYELRHAFGLIAEQHPSLIEAWNAAIKPNKISVEHFHDLNSDSRRLEIAILSNIGHEHIEIVSSRIGGKFDWCRKHMSCEVGLRKPQKMYYKSFLDHHPEFKSAVYVDDRLENLATGSEYDFYTRHLDTSKMSDEQIDCFWKDLKRELLNEY